ncbi:hypothetical protein D3C78_1777340 [compost metagenome]
MPSRGGTSPPTSQFMLTLDSIASAQSNSAMSMYWPTPVWWRDSSAACTALAAYRPVNRSVTATPTLCGSPSAGPVMLISPDMPCTM